MHDLPRTLRSTVPCRSIVVFEVCWFCCIALSVGRDSLTSVRTFVWVSFFRLNFSGNSLLNPSTERGDSRSFETFWNYFETILEDIRYHLIRFYNRRCPVAGHSQSSALTSWNPLNPPNSIPCGTILFTSQIFFGWEDPTFWLIVFSFFGSHPFSPLFTSSSWSSWLSILSTIVAFVAFGGCVCDSVVHRCLVLPSYLLIFPSGFWLSAASLQCPIVSFCAVSVWLLLYASRPPGL